MPCGADLIVIVGTGDDTLIVSALDGTSGTYCLNGGPAVAFSGINGFTFYGQGGNDNLVIHNFVGGEFATPAASSTTAARRQPAISPWTPPAPSSHPAGSDCRR